MQAEPSPQPGPVNINLNLDALAGLIWQWFIDHIGDVGKAVWTNLLPSLPAVGGQVLGLVNDSLHTAAAAIWTAVWGSSTNIVTQLPADLTYQSSWYRAIATDPVPLAVGGATLALVLLGLRTMFGAMVGRDHVITHVSGRLIPAVFLTLAYPVLIARGAQLLNAAATGLGSVNIGEAVAFPSAAIEPALTIPYALLWLLLVYYAIRLLIRLAYSVVRLLVALVFGPVALILWAIPQTEWVTSLWLRELLAWSTTPLLVTAALAMAIPLATGRGGFLAAAAFGIAGFQAAYDLVGLLGNGRGGGRLFPFTFATVRAAAGGASAGVAAASIPANRVTTLADQYGYQ